MHYTHGDAFDCKALVKGKANEASVDFTGGIPEVVDLAEINSTKSEKEIKHFMNKTAKSHAFMSCALTVSISRNLIKIGLTQNFEKILCKFYASL